jgi:glycosyltransferase involved in cell wall biosynthesis
MRIGLYNVRVGTYATGGTETFIREITTQLAKDHEVFIYTAGENVTPELQSLDATVRTVPFLRGGTRFTNTLTGIAPIHAHEIESLSMYAAARRHGFYDRIDAEVDVLSTHSLLDNALATRQVDVPTVFRVPGIRQGSFRWRQLLSRDRSTVRVANSEATADRLDEWLGAAVDGVVYAGLDLNQFSSDGPSVGQPEEASILYLGRLDDGKGLFDLLAAHARLCEAGPVLLRLVGDGGIEDDLRERAAALGTLDHVEFVGAVPHSRVQEHYRGAQIYCLPSYSEGFPLGNIEAMACGTPVVSTDIAPVREQIEQEETGLLIEPGDVDALESALSRLVSDSDLRETLSRRARQWVQRLSWQQQASVMESFYRKAIERAGQPESSS